MHLRVHVLVCVHVNDKSRSLSVYVLRPCSCSSSCMNIPMLKFKETTFFTLIFNVGNGQTSMLELPYFLATFQLSLPPTN